MVTQGNLWVDLPVHVYVQQAFLAETALAVGHVDCTARGANVFGQIQILRGVANAAQLALMMVTALLLGEIRTATHAHGVREDGHAHLRSLRLVHGVRVGVQLRLRLGVSVGVGVVVGVAMRRLDRLLQAAVHMLVSPSLLAQQHAQQLIAMGTIGLGLGQRLRLIALVELLMRERRCWRGRRCSFRCCRATT